MPEGDTVWHTAATLREHLAGQTLTRCDVRVPQFATVDLTGNVVDEVLSRGKHLFIRVGRASIHSHLKMEGSWRVGNRPVRVDHRARIVLEANDVRAVGVDLGVLEILDRDHDGEVVAHLGPDLLGPDWDAQIAGSQSGRTPGPADCRGAAGPTCAGRGGECLLQRAVFRQRTSAHRAGQRDRRPASFGLPSPGHAVGQSLSLEPLYHR